MTFLVDRDKEIQELRELKMQDTAVENCQDEARLEEVKKGSAIAGDRGNECNLNRPYRFYCLRRRCCCSGGEVLREASALTFWKNPFSLWRPSRDCSQIEDELEERDAMDWLHDE